MSKDLSRGRDKLAERYKRYGDPRRKDPGARPSSNDANDHAARVVRRIERKKADDG